MNKEPKLLTRDQFREQVLARSNHKCIFCQKPAVDAHHILERRLWPDGGYYLENGAAVCEEHHLQCEQTVLSVEDVRFAAGITRIIVPPHLYADHIYDKWGNPVIDGVRRCKGELFYNESVQKVLKEGNALDLFTDYVKYPRTHHVPWSPGCHHDDKMLENMNALVGKRVVVTEKMDGENTTLYSNYIHARSIDGRSHPSRDWVKNFHSKSQGDIPPGFRICGENLYAKHPIEYKDLPTYFMGFSIWEQDVCYSWDVTKELFELLGIVSVPVLYDGVYDEAKIKCLWDDSKRDVSEGYVLRLADSFTYRNFKTSVAKFVREGHVQTTKHWMHGQRIEKNELVKYE